MKKQIVNCETGLTEIVDCTPEEIAQALERSALVEQQSPPPPTLEDRLKQLETQLSTLKGA